MLQGDDLAAFMTNVSVGGDSRGQGIGKALLEESILKAKISWGTSRIFAFVDSDNEVIPSAQDISPSMTSHMAGLHCDRGRRG